MNPASKHDMPGEAPYRRYWRIHLRILLGLLSVWFLFGCVLSIFLVEPLNEWKVGGFPLGFWMAQQGTIFAFIALILAYSLIMKWLDRRFDVHEEES